MARIEVATPAEVLAAEEAFAALVVAALRDVARRSAETLGADTIITAATVTETPGPGEPLPPPDQSAAAVEDIGIIPALWTVQVTATLMPELSAIYELSGTHILTAIGEAFPDLADIPAVSGFAAAEQRLANAQNRLVGIGDMLWEQARDQLLTGFAAGEDIGQLRDRVQAAAGVTDARAERIARTEVISASNAGSIDQVRAAGLVGTKEWLATPDERTRCTHRKAEGQTVDLGAKFVLGGFGADDEIGCADVGASYGDYPGDPALPAAEAINCRCSMAYDVDVPALTAGMVNGQQLNGQQLEGGVMPWHIVEDSSQCPTSRPYAVVKDATGQVEGCHPSRMAASDQLAALYAAEKAMAEQDCPEGEHRMPDGECMMDDEMPSRAPDYTTQSAGAVQRWEGTLAIEGVETGDGRMFNVDALTWRDLPVPLMYQKVTSHGGIDDVTVNVGSIDEIWRDGNLIWARGRLDMEDPNGVEVERKMRMGFIRGVSIDADSIKDADVELVFPGSSHGEDVLADLFASPELTIFNKGRISAATVVNIPAFQEARLFLVDAETGALVAAGADAEGEGSHAADAPTEAEVREAVTAQVAAAYTIEIPDLPPADWFEEPAELPPIGALWVTAEGRIFGLVGPGDTAHRSFRDRRVTIPMGNVDYAAWMNRPTLVQGGKRVATGVITMNCGHASPLGPLDPGERMKHYDNSCSIAAVVAVGESKKFGAPWVSGVLMPMDAEQAQRFMACQLSGDWAPHREKPGWREFVAALAVPVPGFARATKVRVVDDVLVSSAVPIRSWEEYQSSTAAEPEPELVTAAAAPPLTDEQRSQLAGLRDRLGLSEQAKLKAIADRMRTTVATAPRPAPVPGTFEGAKQVVPCAPCAAEKQRRAAAVKAGGDRNRAKLDRIVRRARSLQARAYHGHSPPQRAFHLPGEHDQKDHAGIGSVLDGIEVLNQDDFSGLYGEMADERSVELEGFSLTARYFDSGESAVVIDLPDDRYQVLDETSPEGMSQLAYDIEDALSQADDYEDSEEVVWDTDSPRHEFSVAVTGEGVVQLRPLSGDDFLELLPQEARDFANALHDLVASYEKSEEEGGFDGPENGQKAASSVDRHRAALSRIVTRVRSLQVRDGQGPAPPAAAFHLPGKHPQKDHGRDGAGLPDGGGMPGEVVSIPFDKLPGDVKVAAPEDGNGEATLSIGGRTTQLTEQDRKDLRSLVIDAQYNDESRAGSDGVFRLYRPTKVNEEGKVESDYKVSLRPVPGAFITESGKRVDSIEEAPEDEEVYAAEFDLMVDEDIDADFDGQPMSRVTLKDIDPSNRKSILRSLARAGAARRIDTGNGPTDVYSPRPGAVSLRMKDDSGNPTEVMFDKKVYNALKSAIEDVLYGEGEGVPDLTVPRDERKVIQTPEGDVEVRFKGRQDDAGKWDGVLTMLPSDDRPWSVAVDGPHIDEFWNAFRENGEEHDW